MIQLIIGLIVLAFLSGFFKDFFTKRSKNAYRKKRIPKTEKLYFTTSADFLTFYDGIYEYAKQVEIQTPKPKESDLTSHQYDIEYPRYVRSLYDQMFARYPQLITIDEENYGFFHHFGKEPYKEFNTKDFLGPQFFEQTVRIEFDAEVTDVYGVVSYTSGRDKTLYTSRAPKGRLIYSINKGEVIKLKGYIDGVTIRDWLSKFKANDYHIGFVFDL